MLEEQIVAALKNACRPLQSAALIAAVFPDGATDEQVQQLRFVANEMINAGELMWISGEGYYLIPSP